ncbi:ATP-binding protein [Actinoplanes sp. NPDC049316]|uniref:hybrid sensor histidine kinase/response regulator n=1 Tax=Actinoplanes sp. NPDC049316 TaxID=3154727 RepID=UPI00341D5166
MAAVLVVEDNPDHQHAIAEVVRRLGHEVVLADDGRAGLAAVAEHRPDLIVADVDMPFLNGLQMCRMLREVPEFAGIPVALVTAYLPPSDPRLASTGAVAVVPKPFTMQELTGALLPYLSGEQPPAPFPAPDDAAPAGFADALLHSLDVGVAACDASGRLVVLNRVMREIFGDASGEVPLTEWPREFVLRHHDGAPITADRLPLVRALAGEEVRHADVLTHDRAGRRRWLDINARPVRAGTGTVLGAVAAVHDVTGEHRSRQYERCKTKVLEILAASPDTDTAADNLVRAIGESLEWPYVRLWLIDEVSARLRSAATYAAPGERPLPVPAGFACGQGLAGQCWEQAQLVWVPDIHASASPVLPDVAASAGYRAAVAVPVRSGDRVTGVLTIFSHSLQEPEPSLTVLLTGIAGNVGAYLEKRRAEDLSRHLAAATDEYIALVGHELRTPLTSIGAYTELIMESDDATPVGEIRPLLEIVERNNVLLRQLVENLLDLAALESGHAGLTVADVDLVAVVSAAVEAVAPAAREHRITVAPGVPESLTITGDRRRLGQVVESLLDNAIKFSPDESTVRVELAADGDAAVLAVSDAGIGVPPEDQPRVFRRLYRAGNARHSAVRGAGLGLALSRAVVERHHGTIVLNSRPPAGTTVTVRLPRRS